MSARRAGLLVAFAALHAHKAVLDHVQTAVAVAAGDLVHRVDAVQIAHLLAVDRQPAGRSRSRCRRYSGCVGRLLRVDRDGPDVGRRLVPGILQHAAFDGAAPQVVVDGVRRLLRGGAPPRRARAAHSISDSGVVFRSHSRTGAMISMVGIERGDGRLEADLVVALTGAAVRNVLRAAPDARNQPGASR